MKVPIPKASFPAWGAWLKKTTPKFGGSGSGYQDMKTALAAIKRFESEPGILLPGQTEIYTNVHLIHEVRSEVAEWSNPAAVSFAELEAGIREGRFPKIVGFIPPNFGFPGSDLGGLVADDEEARKAAADLTLESLVQTDRFAEQGLALGIVIGWPAFQAFRTVAMGPSYRLNRQGIKNHVRWARFRSGLADVLRTAKARTGKELKLWIEWKVNDPETLDVVPTLSLALEFCDEVDNEAGWKAVAINNEFAHLALVGIGFTEGMQQTIAAGRFDRLVHLNAGPVSPVRLDEALARPEGIHPADWFGGIDPDWPLGYGSDNAIADQAGAIACIAKWAAETGISPVLEHDVFHGPRVAQEGDLWGKPGAVVQPEDTYGFSIRNANRMWQDAVAAFQP